MAQRAFVLFADSENWRLAARTSTGPQFTDLPIPDHASPDQIAAVVASALSTAGHAGETILLAIPSSWCLAASIAISDLPRHDRQAMLYRLEEKLPLAAEGIVADFIRHQGNALGVCAKISVLAPLIEALEARQIPVQSVTAAALLAAQALESPNDSPRVLLCGQADGQIDLIALDGATPVSWESARPEAGDIQLHLEMLGMTLAAKPAIEALQLDPPVIAGLENSLGESIRVLPGRSDSMAVEAAEQILSGRQRPWIELRRGTLAIRDSLRLHRRPLNAALAGTLILLLCVAGSLLYRAHRYTEQAALAERQQIQAFREQFPGWEVPPNVRVIVESEHRKAALAAGGAAPVHAERSALQTLTDILNRLPASERISINRMSFGESSFELEGQVRSNEQLDGIASAARQAGMDVETPDARKNADGFWNFIIRGAAPSADKPAGQVATEGS
ncbi:MAG TPA: GspL/Epsl periplasmic domain-containing protein [Tepidisphaeraceae bacterium]|nr:GspL/Epsl periplasmic domain-containing protein [Tepidisphaeraceae bacterium]